VVGRWIPGKRVMTEELSSSVPSTMLEFPKVLTLKDGEKILHTKCTPVASITPEVQAIATMLETFLQLHQGDDPRPIGIAAPQLGYTIRMFSCIYASVDVVVTIINPELIYEKKQRMVAESCFSIPGQRFMVKRGKIVKISGMMVDGKIHSFRGHDLIAQEYLHELDHLSGITINMIGRVIV
jgi:peptide deformylase